MKVAFFVHAHPTRRLNDTLRYEANPEAYREEKLAEAIAGEEAKEKGVRDALKVGPDAHSRRFRCPF